MMRLNKLMMNIMIILKIRKLGYEPKVYLEEGLEITFRWLKENQKLIQQNND